MAASSPDDPYSWTVDRLVYELCHNPQPIWAFQAKQAQMPQKTIFEKAIRDNVLDGESFMAMDIQNIASDLNLPAFGIKRNIFKIIQFFRSISPEWRRQNIVDQVMPYINGVESPQITTSNLSGLPQSVSYNNQAQRSPLLQTPFSATPTQWPSSAMQNPHSGVIPRPFLSETLLNEARQSADDMERKAHEPEEDMSVLMPKRIPQLDSSLRTGMDDDTGQRVGIDPGNSAEAMSLRKTSNITSAQVKPEDEVAAHFAAMSKPRKRIAPTSVSQNSPKDMEQHNISRLGENPISDKSTEDADFRTGFQLTGSTENHEAKMSTASTTKSLLLARSIRSERSHQIPQDENPFLVPEQQLVEQGKPTTISSSSDLPEELAILLAKYPPIDGDDGYEIFGNSGDEGEYDDDTWKEIDQETEENQAKPASANMSEAAVNAAIDEAVAAMIVEWNTKKLPKTQVKGCNMWEQATKDQSVAQYMATSESVLNTCKRRIVRLRAAITDVQWAKAAEVKVQCQSLEESVFQQEEQQHYLSVLKHNEPPFRPDRETLSRARKYDRPEMPEGEELLESDSESSSMRGFVEDDSSYSGSIPHHVSDACSVDADANTASNSELPQSRSESPFPSGEEPLKLVEDSSTDSDDQIVSSCRRRQSKRSLVSENVTPDPESHPLSEVDESPANSSSDSDLNATRQQPRSSWLTPGTQNEPIELMSSSPAVSASSDRRPSTGSVRTPSLNPDETSPSSSDVPKHLQRNISDIAGPTLEDVEGIQALEWDDIEADGDARRALAKAVYGLEHGPATRLHTYVDSLLTEKPRTCEVLKQAVSSYGRREEIPKVAARDQSSVQRLGLLFVTYYYAMDCMTAPTLAGGLQAEAYDAIADGSSRFLRLLDRVLKRHCGSTKSSKKLGKKRKSEEIELLEEPTDDSDALMLDEEKDNDEAPGTKSAKKRKRKVIQSQEAATQQYDDQMRIVEQEMKRAALQKKMREMADNADGDLDRSSLHPVSFDTNHPIYLDEHIGKKVKEHQERGIQFMWRELSAGKGCMLAHTMGLGKTMQVISLLVTIAQSSQSKDENILNQVPEDLRVSRTLILSPPSLVDNWYDEILMWTPPGASVLGEVRKVVSATVQSVRKSSIRRWARDGGIVLMSYSIFKSIVHNSVKHIGQEESEPDYAEMLTHKPSIVVADEAHHMKNPKSVLARAAMKVTTMARIALTGSPLSNHLEEYHQMVDWISPGYLGNLVQFKAKYSEPIKLGLYSDSSRSERRISARKLHVLKRDLDPKICRADISVIAKDMPNKVEFFITIPLTEAQKTTYAAYVTHALQDHGGGSFAQTKLWSWLSILSLLLNHPSTFVQKLQARNESEIEAFDEEEREASADTEDFALPADVPSSSVGLTPEATKDILRAFSTMTQADLEAIHHSYRSVLTSRIVMESMRIKEKVLIFSHSIPTLNYLEQMLNQLHCRYSRIDGKTSMSSRQGTVKTFNISGNVDVMLISTTAGGLGLNLQGANRVILYDFNFNPMWEEQAVGRAYRLGQKRNVFVYRFRAGGTFEETIYNTSIFKTQLFARVVDKRNPMRHASKNLSDYLFLPREVKQADLNEGAGKDPEVLDQIMKNETCIRKIELTETFQVEEDDELTPEDVEQANQEYQDEVLGRTNPAALAKLINERENKRREVEYAQGGPYQTLPQMRPYLDASRLFVDAHPAATQSYQAVYPQGSAVLRSLPTPPRQQPPGMQLGSYDDTNMSPPATMPPRIPELEGVHDRPLACNPQ